MSKRREYYRFEPAKHADLSALTITPSESHPGLVDAVAKLAGDGGVLEARFIGCSEFAYRFSPLSRSVFP